MSQLRTSNAIDTSVRQLSDAELDFVAGGVIDGCIPNGPFGPGNPLPTYNRWLDPYSPQRRGW